MVLLTPLRNGALQVYHGGAYGAAKIPHTLQSGSQGSSAHRLERVATEVRKFLESIASDIDLPDYKWVGTSFRNRSVSWLNETEVEANPLQLMHFNEAVLQLARGYIPQFVTNETAAQFYEMATPFEREDRLKVAVYPMIPEQPRDFLVEPGHFLFPPTRPLPSPTYA